MADFAATLAARMNAQSPRVPVVLAVPTPTPTPADAPEYLRLFEAAERARVTTKTLTAWEAMGLKISRIGRVALVKTTDLDAFISRGGK